jgi:hypothetical protein
MHHILLSEIGLKEIQKLKFCHGCEIIYVAWTTPKKDEYLYYDVNFIEKIYM